MFLSEIVRIMERHPWCNGIDIGLENGDDCSMADASTAMFKNICGTVRNYDSSRLMNIHLPGMKSINESAGGENWCVPQPLLRHGVHHEYGVELEVAFAL